MRKVMLVVAAVSGMSLLATMSASTAPVGGAKAMIDAARACPATEIETVEWRCRVRCWWYAGERICRRRCYRY